jgi:hypothetical protein
VTVGVPPRLVLGCSLGSPAFPSLVVVLHSEKITHKKKKKIKQPKQIYNNNQLTNHLQIKYKNIIHKTIKKVTAGVPSWPVVGCSSVLLHFLSLLLSLRSEKLHKHKKVSNNPKTNL